MNGGNKESEKIPQKDVFSKNQKQSEEGEANQNKTVSFFKNFLRGSSRASSKNNDKIKSNYESTNQSAVVGVQSSNQGQGEMNSLQIQHKHQKSLTDNLQNVAKSNYQTQENVNLKNIKSQNDKNQQNLRNVQSFQNLDLNNDGEKEKKRDGSNAFLRDNKIAAKISNNIKAVGGLATQAFRSLKRSTSRQSQNVAQNIQETQNQKQNQETQNNASQQTIYPQIGSFLVPNRSMQQIQTNQFNSVETSKTGNQNEKKNYNTNYTNRDKPPNPSDQKNKNNQRKFSVNRTSTQLQNNGQPQVILQARENRQYNKSISGMIITQNQSLNQGKEQVKINDVQDDKGDQKSSRRDQNDANKPKHHMNRQESVFSNNQNPSRQMNHVPVKPQKGGNQSFLNHAGLDESSSIQDQLQTVGNMINKNNNFLQKKGSIGILPRSIGITQNSTQESLNQSDKRDQKQKNSSRIPPLNLPKSLQQINDNSDNNTLPKIAQPIQSHRSNFSNQDENHQDNKNSYQINQNENQVMRNLKQQNGPQSTRGDISQRSNSTYRSKQTPEMNNQQLSIEQNIQIFNQRCDMFIFKSMPKADKLTLDSVFHVSQFCEDIQFNMLKNEKKWSIDFSYMDRQQKLNETIRSTLIDWLIQTHYNFKLQPESLFLTINLIDRYFQTRQITKREVQLIAVASMLIATKYEEIYPPLLKDFVFITDNVFSADEILEMELDILVALDFDIQLTTSYRFLERFAKIRKLDAVSFFIAQYLLELGLLDSKMYQFKHSLQAVAAIYTAMKYLRLHNSSSASSRDLAIQVTPCLKELNLASVYTDDDVKECAKCYNQLAILIQTSNLQMICQKFKSSKYFEVSRIVTSALKIKRKISQQQQIQLQNLNPSTSQKKLSSNQ